MSAVHRGVCVLVAYYAPPAVGIAAQRVASFAEHLPELGWYPVIVAPRSAHYHQDPGSAALLASATVVRTPNPEMSRLLRRVMGAPDARPGSGIAVVQEVQAGGWGRIFRRLVREGLYVPDAQSLWIPFAARAVTQAVKSVGAGPVVIHSSSVPYSAHFAARRAAEVTGAPWAAEYRDPWSSAPPQVGRRSTWRQHVDSRLDEEVMRAADAVVATSNTTARLFERTFSHVLRNPVHVVRNGFGEAPLGAPPDPGDALRLVYSGTLLSPDYARPLLQALSTVEEGEPGAARLDVYGPPEPWLEAWGGTAGFVNLHGVVPGHEMPGHLAAASANVLLQPLEAHALHIAGKLYEYLGSRRPVLAALPRGCEAEELVRAHGDLRSLDLHDAEGMEGAVMRLLEEHRAGTLQRPRVSVDVVESLSRKAQAGRLAEIFDALVAAS